MKLPVNYTVKSIKISELLKTLKQEEVLSLCQGCHNFSKNHSCPNFTFNTMSYLEDYTYASLILTDISSKPLKENWEHVLEMSFDSRIRAVYSDTNNGETLALSSKISMYVFNEIKDYMTDFLMSLEERYKSIISSPPGSCTRCLECTKKAGKDCIHPDLLRYSLESLGFMVSDIYKDFFDIELGWTKDELSNSFHSCSCLFTKEKLDDHELRHIFINQNYQVQVI